MTRKGRQLFIEVNKSGLFDIGASFYILWTCGHRINQASQGVFEKQEDRDRVGVA